MWERGGLDILPVHWDPSPTCGSVLPVHSCQCREFYYHVGRYDTDRIVVTDFYGSVLGG